MSAYANVDPYGHINLLFEEDGVTCHVRMEPKAAQAFWENLGSAIGSARSLWEAQNAREATRQRDEVRGRLRGESGKADYVRLTERGIEASETPGSSE